MDLVGTVDGLACNDDSIEIVALHCKQAAQTVEYDFVRTRFREFDVDIVAHVFGIGCILEWNFDLSSFVDTAGSETTNLYNPVRDEKKKFDQ